MNLTLDDLREHIKKTVSLALAEDIRNGDITATLIPEDKQDRAHIVAKEPCVICGTEWVNETFQQLGQVDVAWNTSDGENVKENSVIAELNGNSRNLLTGERTALNFLQTLSGVATKTQKFVALTKNSNTKILDTRKTIPGLRLAQKYAVATGGGKNHRIGLFDAYLIKENHIAACGSITQAVQYAKKRHPEKPIEVEVENISELKEAILSCVDTIMLDNFSEEQLKQAVQLDRKGTKYELSGNLSDEDIVKFCNYNIDYMSFGALTKHVSAIDFSMRIV